METMDHCLELTIVSLDGRQCQLKAMPDDQVAQILPQVATEFGIPSFSFMSTFTLTCADRVLTNSDIIRQLPTYQLQIVKRLMNRDVLVYFAKLAEQAEHWDEMAAYMAEAAKLPDVFSAEERKLLSAAFKNAVSRRCAAWGFITSVAQKEQSKGNEEQAMFAREYVATIEAELESICHTLLSLLDIHLIPKADPGESKIFYLKMKSDHYRYLAQFMDGDAKRVAYDNASVAHEEAQRCARTDLPVTHPTYLSLALSNALWTYEVLNMPDEACRIARTAFEDAIAELDSVQEDTYKESVLIMQLLRDNLTQWTSDQNDGRAP